MKVLLTGITGFIAKRIALDLLRAGHHVTGSRRTPARDAEVRDALRPHLDADALSRLSFVALDLTSDDGWDEAMAGQDALIHTASPFPGPEPKDPDDLIVPAVEGTLRALGAAQRAGVTRVVLTSSMVAIMYGDHAKPGATVGPDDWSQPGHASMGAYATSKTLAERAAWEFCARHPEMRLTAINPGLVAGAPVDARYGTSLDVIRQFLTGKLPAIPNFGLPIVDIADVSAAHVAALTTPGSEGRRFALAAEFVMAPRMAEMLREIAPESKVPKRRAPDWLVGVMALFDAQARALKPILGIDLAVDNTATREVLGIDFTPTEDALRASVRALGH
ncbi:MAG: NAD-dependent epimerase/dehydratase family protein [Paracoccaceae bacterium]